MPTTIVDAMAMPLLESGRHTAAQWMLPQTLKVFRHAPRISTDSTDGQ